MRVGNIYSFDSVLDIISETHDQPTGKKIGIFPGAFKPPHRGHYATAATACSVCDELYIIMSSKDRVLGKPSADGGLPEWVKFKSLLPGGKSADKLKNVQVELAEVDRQTSASKMRTEILNTSLNTDDIETFIANVGPFLPPLDEASIREICGTLMAKSVRDGVISANESSRIWELYINQLKRDYSNVQIHFSISEISPIIDTHELVIDVLDNEPANILLYTGQ